MRIKTMALIKGTDEKTSVSNGKLYRNVLLFGTEGLPCDLRAGCNDDSNLFEKAKKHIYQKGLVEIELQVYDGRHTFALVSFDPVKGDSQRPPVL